MTGGWSFWYEKQTGKQTAIIFSEEKTNHDKINVVRATVDALQNLRTLDEVAALRGKKPEEIRG